MAQEAEQAERQPTLQTEHSCMVVCLGEGGRRLCAHHLLCGGGRGVGRRDARKYRAREFPEQLHVCRGGARVESSHMLSQTLHHDEGHHAGGFFVVFSLIEHLRELRAAPDGTRRVQAPLVLKRADPGVRAGEPTGGEEGALHSEVGAEQLLRSRRTPQ